MTVTSRADPSEMRVAAFRSFQRGMEGTSKKEQEGKTLKNSLGPKRGQRVRSLGSPEGILVSERLLQTTGLAPLSTHVRYKHNISSSSSSCLALRTEVEPQLGNEEPPTFISDSPPSHRVGARVAVCCTRSPEAEVSTVRGACWGLEEAL